MIDMFFKMLKNDLKQKKGLSIVLFLFILTASVLVFIGAVQLYEFFTGTERNQSVCKSSDVMIFNVTQGSNTESSRKKADDVIKKNKHIVSDYRREAIYLQTTGIDFDFVD